MNIAKKIENCASLGVGTPSRRTYTGYLPGLPPSPPPRGKLPIWHGSKDSQLEVGVIKWVSIFQNETLNNVHILEEHFWKLTRERQILLHKSSHPRGSFYVLKSKIYLLWVSFTPLTPYPTFNRVFSLERKFATYPTVRNLPQSGSGR